MSFARNTSKNLSNKYSQTFIDTANKSTTDAIKTTSRRAIQKTAEATGDLTGNKKASISKSPQNNKANIEMEIAKERYIFPEKRKRIIDEFKLV